MPENRSPLRAKRRNAYGTRRAGCSARRSRNRQRRFRRHRQAHPQAADQARKPDLGFARHSRNKKGARKERPFYFRDFISPLRYHREPVFYFENGYINHAIPTPMAKNKARDHKA